MGLNAEMSAVRTDWIELATRIAWPVLEAASEGRLHTSMPVETREGVQTVSAVRPASGRATVSSLEAFCRTLFGLAPWLAREDEAGANHGALCQMAVKALGHLADPSSPDHPDVDGSGQTLVEAAFLSSALLKCHDAVWMPLPPQAKDGILRFLKATRTIRPAFSNWLLFSAMVEAFLHRAGEDWDVVRVDYAVRQHEQWYAGDGMFTDGIRFHWDYYNSFVILPFLHEILHADPALRALFPGHAGAAVARLRRQAAVLERMIASDGTFPPIGRSIAYRCGAFHALAYAAWKDLLPEGVPPASVRGALAAVQNRTLGVPGTFDAQGWLRIGLSGHQPQLAEPYISTGSLYLCLATFLPLGLPASHAFWAGPEVPWTAPRLWQASDEPADSALHPDPRLDC